VSKILCLTLCFGIGLGAIMLSRPASSRFAFWTVSSLDRVGRLTPRPADQETTVLSAAKGEYTSFQVIVKAPEQGLEITNLTSSDLIDPNGGTIPAQNIALFREHYVYVNRSSPDWKGTNRPLGPAWYPDALIPFVDPSTGTKPRNAVYHAIPAHVAPDENQPFWVDVFVPYQAVAGHYTGHLSVTTNEGSASIPMSLTVWNFAMPHQPSLRSSFAFWTAGTKPAVEELMRNRVMPQKLAFVACKDVTCPELVGLERELAQKFGLSNTDTGMWSGGERKSCTMREAPSVQDFKKLSSTHLPGLYLFNYTADEIEGCPSLVPKLKLWAKNMHAAGIKNLVAMVPDPALYHESPSSQRSAVDIWGVLPRGYDLVRPRIQEVQKRGNEVWSYNAVVQDAYSPKWQIDFAPINYRIQAGFLSQSLSLTGLLYWRIDHWSADPWNQVNNSGIFSSNNYPGEGMLVYPGHQVGVAGVVASMRLKQLRDGVQDYEYIQMLKQMGRGDWALSQSRAVAADWSHWTQDNKKLLNLRCHLGEEIDRLSSAQQITSAVAPRPKHH
jgi:Domain of unknown function (DUF4091)